MQKSEFIDYARGFSILTIVVFHLTQGLALPKILTYAFTFGSAGVHLFFFSSGFGLAKSNYTTYLAFLKKRLNNVLIPYYITITIIFLANFWFKVYPPEWSKYLSHIFLYKMFWSRLDESLGGHFWFISTIIQFYLVFPLLLFFLRTKKYRRFFISSLIVSLTYSLGVGLSIYAQRRAVNGFFLQYLWEFTLGMVVAKTNSLDKLLRQPVIYYFIIAAICIPATALLALKGGAVGENLNDVFAFSGYTAIVIILYRLVPPLNKVILWITGFSYTLYLVHMFIFGCLYRPFMSGIFKGFTLPVIFLMILLISYYYNLLLAKITNPRTTKV